MRASASIVVRSYNYASFVGEAIESALAQTHPGTEVIVVDDGSTDGSQDVIRSYGNAIVPILKKKNEGTASGIAAGFEASSGDFIVFLDSDDTIDRDTIEHAMELTDDSVSKVHWTLKVIDHCGEETGRVVPLKKLPDDDLLTRMIVDGPRVSGGPPMSGNAWSRRVLARALPILHPRGGYYLDAYLHTVAGVTGTVRRLDRPHGRYRVHGGNQHAGGALETRVTQSFRNYHYRCRALSLQLASAGIAAPPAAWKTGNRFYEQISNRFFALQEIAAIVPRGETFIVADEGKLASGEILEGRRSLRLQFDHALAGRPSNSAEAIEKLEQLRALGAGFVVFVRPALGWLKRFTGLRDYLTANYSCELANERVVIFNLTDCSSA